WIYPGGPNSLSGCDLAHVDRDGRRAAEIDDDTVTFSGPRSRVQGLFTAGPHCKNRLIGYMLPPLPRGEDPFEHTHLARPWRIERLSPSEVLPPNIIVPVSMKPTGQVRPVSLFANKQRCDGCSGILGTFLISSFIQYHGFRGDTQVV